MPIKIPQTLVDELIRLNVLTAEDVTPLFDLAQNENKDFGQVVIEKLLSPMPIFLRLSQNFTAYLQLI